MTVLYAKAMVERAPMMLKILVGVSSPSPVLYRTEPGGLLAPAITRCHVSIQTLLAHRPLHPIARIARIARIESFQTNLPACLPALASCPATCPLPPVPCQPTVFGGDSGADDTEDHGAEGGEDGHLAQVVQVRHHQGLDEQPAAGDADPLGELDVLAVAVLLVYALRREVHVSP